MQLAHSVKQEQLLLGAQVLAPCKLAVSALVRLSNPVGSLW